MSPPSGRLGCISKGEGGRREGECENQNLLSGGLSQHVLGRLGFGAEGSSWVRVCGSGIFPEFLFFNMKVSSGPPVRGPLSHSRKRGP